MTNSITFSKSAINCDGGYRRSGVKTVVLLAYIALSWVGLCSQASGQTISTVAGNGSVAFSGDGGAATSAAMSTSNVVVDVSGNLYIADSANHRIRKVSTNGIVTTVAGNGSSGFSGDGGEAVAASLSLGEFTGLAIDASGDLFVADAQNNRIRKVSPGGIITTIAGNGTRGFSGDGGPATSASLNMGGYSGLAVDVSGNLFIADSENNRIRKISPNGVITTVVGDGSYGSTGDGGPATLAGLTQPLGLVVDGSGDLFIADTNGGVVRKVSASGSITTVAGSGCYQAGLPGRCMSATLGDGGPATSATMYPTAVALDSSGELLIADAANARIRKVSAAGVITTVAGDGSSAFSGDGGPATSAALSYPQGIVVGAGGNLFIADTDNNRIREVSGGASAASISVTPSSLNFKVQAGASGQIQAIEITGSAGTSWQAVATSPNGSWLSVQPSSGQTPATLAAIVNSASMQPGVYQGSITIQAPGAAPPSSTIGVTLTVTSASGPGGAISTIAGNGTAGFLGDGGQATLAELYHPAGVTVDGSGNLFVADSANHAVRKISVAGVITTVASFSGGTPSAPGEGILGDVVVDAAGNLFIADSINQVVRKLSATGALTTVAGNGTQGYSGDGGSAAAASLNWPAGLAVDGNGNLFIADSYNNRIRKVSANGIITTIAGNGAEAFSGDGGPAASASLFLPNGVALDTSGNLFIADFGNNRVRKVSVSGIITTVAGVGPTPTPCNTPGVCILTPACAGLSGDGGPATSASVCSPYSVAVDAGGDLFIADAGNSRIREVSPGGAITTVAGDGSVGFSGDGGPATSAALNSPYGVAVDATGNIFIGDLGNNRVREVFASSEPKTAIQLTSVGNAASFTQSFAPGMLMSVFGAGLATGSPQTVTTAPLPFTSSSGTSISINGIPAPLLYISPTQINLQIPYEVSVGAAVLTLSAGGQSASINFTIQDSAPGIFVDAQNGHVVPNESAAPGSTIELYLTGAGQVTPAEATGNVPVAGTTPVPNLPLSLTVGGVSVTPVYVGTPGWSVGVVQINFTVPMVPAGPQPVRVAIGGVDSQVAVLTITAAAQIQSLTLSSNSTTGGAITGTVVLSSAAPSGGAVVALSSSSSNASMPATVTVPAGATSATFTISIAAVSSSQTVTIMASYGGASSSASLTVMPPVNSQCANIGGSWNASESGSANYSIVAPIESDNFTDLVSGSGAVTITQTGCSIQYEPIIESGLIGSSLTADQLASLVRTGTVNADSVSVTGLLALVDTVQAAQSGLTINNVSANSMTATGQVSGAAITLNETGNFSASGTYSLSGQTGSFTLTITTSSVASFDRPQSTPSTDKTMLRPQSSAGTASSVEIRVVPDRLKSSSPTAREEIASVIKATVKKALICRVK